MEQTFRAHCSCGNVEIEMKGEPKVRGYCHCSDCRELLNIPFHAVNAWLRENITIKSGSNRIKQFKHPNLQMIKHFCSSCGDVVFNTNSADWAVFSQHFISKSYENILPDILKSKSHFFYDQRLFDIDDDLPKKS